MLGNLFGGVKKEEMLKAKQEYEKARLSTGDSRSEIAARIRVGLRCRAVIDKTFIEGAEKTADFTERCMVALAAGDEKPHAPTATAFQKIKSVNGEILAYIPLEFAEEVFKIGAAFQLEEVSAEQAIELAQAVAERLSEDIHLDPPIQALGFLREELAEGGDEDSGDDSRGSDQEDGSDEAHDRP
jgi:hypothetical protein